MGLKKGDVELVQVLIPVVIDLIDKIVTASDGYDKSDVPSLDVLKQINQELKDLPDL